MPLRSLPDERFLIFGVLAQEGAVSRLALVSMLGDRFGWTIDADALSVLMAKLLATGLICQDLMDGRRFYRLTRAGLAEWQRRFDFLLPVLTNWSDLRKSAVPASFPRAASSERQPKLERLPNPGEVAAILERADAAFRDLYNVSVLVARNPYDLAAAQIEDVDFRSRMLRLPASAVTGSPIVDRTVRIDPRIRSTLKQAITPRVLGPVFLTTSGKPWNEGSIARSFRAARRRAQLPEEIVLSGRGRAART